MRWTALAALFLLVAGCGGGEPSEEQARPAVDSVALAQAQYDPSLFDTVTWESPEKAAERGGLVYRVSCQKCHGERGLGDARFVFRGDTLQPPSFREPDWRFAGDREGLREQVYVGTNRGMPHWGLVGLTPRDVDAVAVYILDVLRRR